MTCRRARLLEQRLAEAESLLLDAAWAFRHLAPDLDLDSRAAAYQIVARVQDHEADWHLRRQQGERLPHCPHPQESAA